MLQNRHTDTAYLLEYLLFLLTICKVRYRLLCGVNVRYIKGSSDWGVEIQHWQR